MSIEGGTWDPTPGGAAGIPDHEHPFVIPDTEQLVRLAEALGGGSFPGIGTIENDTFDLVDSVGPGFPLNIPFLLPANMVKYQKGWLSFKLLPYRQYVSAVVGVSGSFVTAVGTVVSQLVYQVNSTTASGVSSINTSVCVAGCNGTCHTGGVGTTSFVTSVTAFTSGYITLTGPASTGSAVTSVSLTQGIVEGTSATGVTVLIDGTDYTTQLGGPFNADAFELDITSLGWAKTAGIHTLQLTSTQLGRIVGWMRSSYITNPFR